MRFGEFDQIPDVARRQRIIGDDQQRCFADVGDGDEILDPVIDLFKESRINGNADRALE